MSFNCSGGKGGEEEGETFTVAGRLRQEFRKLRFILRYRRRRKNKIKI